VDHRDLAAGAGLTVLAGDWVDDAGAQVVALGRQFDALPKRFEQAVAVDGEVGADPDEVDRDAGVLADDQLGPVGGLDRALQDLS
jgi:hypothetical protein